MTCFPLKSLTESTTPLELYVEPCQGLLQDRRSLWGLWPTDHTERRGHSLQQGAQEPKLLDHEPNTLDFQKSFILDTELKPLWPLVTGQNGLLTRAPQKSSPALTRASSHCRKTSGMKRTWAINTTIWDGKFAQARQRLRSSNSKAWAISEQVEQHNHPDGRCWKRNKRWSHSIMNLSFPLKHVSGCSPLAMSSQHRSIVRTSHRPVLKHTT